MKESLRIAICQMEVRPGRPDRNAEYIIDEIVEAAAKGMDVIIFPEMCTSGYLIGDTFEGLEFNRDVAAYNEKIREATCGLDIVVIFGSIQAKEGLKGEDGRMRKHNSAFIVKDGEWLGIVTKTLHPNYRFFDDDRHFFSQRKKMDHEDLFVEDFFEPIFISGLGKIGVILCEDMWHEDYPINPAQILVDKGAEIIFNLSASPWTWQKNQKRHRVVKKLLEQCNVPLVYVNNTGAQNTGKNVVVFDGSSTVYNEEGEIVFGVMPYMSGTFDVCLTEGMKPTKKMQEDDAAELYRALRCGLRKAMSMLTGENRKIVIGLSGGIDSALVAALMTDVFGSAYVHAINMPSVYNSQETQDLAKQIARNLGIRYEVIPINNAVQSIASAVPGIYPDTLQYENIQARVRMEILAARAQGLGAVFTGNGNKVELAFGHGTLYGDVAGFMLPIGDLIKREVYQLAEYMNKKVFGREVLPARCFDMVPTAELKTAQKDPFDYGNLKRRGYHDEMVRAFVEFRRGPEWFLEKYLEGSLENELMLEHGHLAALFSTPLDLVEDLEKHWKKFHDSVFKRVQSPPILVVSKRAFGTDLRESIFPAYFTLRYKSLKESVLQTV